MTNPQALRKEIEETQKNLAKTCCKGEVYTKRDRPSLNKKLLRLEAELKGHTQAIKEEIEFLESLDNSVKTECYCYGGFKCTKCLIKQRKAQIGSAK